MTDPDQRRSPLAWATTAAVVALAGAVIAILAIALTTAASGIDGDLADGRPAPAPTFNLEVLDRGTLRPDLRHLTAPLADGKLSSAELRGTPVVLNLWASWCLPCRDEAPDLQAAWTSPQARGVLFLGLNSLDGRTDARGFIDEYQLTYPSIREYENTITRAFGARAFPETFFLDARGQIVGHVIGAISPQQITEGIQAARTGKPRPPARGGDQRPAKQGSS